MGRARWRCDEDGMGEVAQIGRMGRAFVSFKGNMGR